MVIKSRLGFLARVFIILASLLIWCSIKQVSERRNWHKMKFVEKQWSAYKEEKEKQKLEQLKQRSENLDSLYSPNKYICKLRKELVILWDKCYISEREKHQFKPFYCGDYTEDLLELHEAEVSRLKKYYEETKKIFLKIAKRDELWKVMRVLEKNSCDNNRFNNHSGNLLQEERQRNKIVKDLPKLEEEILEDISNYEKYSGTLFLINSINFAEKSLLFCGINVTSVREKNTNLSHFIVVTIQKIY